MARRKRDIFLTPEQIYDEWKKWRDSAPDPKDRTISEDMGKMMLEMARRLTYHRNFINYPQFVKDELIQEGVIKIMKNLKNMKEEKKDAFFNYWNTACWTAFVTYLRRYYKHMNEHRRMILDELMRLKCENPTMVNMERIKQLEALVGQFDDKGGRALKGDNSDTRGQQEHEHKEEA